MNSTQVAEQIVRDRCADWRWAGLEEGVAEHSLAVSAVEAGMQHAEVMRAELAAAVGYMMNAKIDLETGCSKATAIKTIEGGIRRFRAALEASA